MPMLQPVSAKAMIRILIRLGYVKLRARGSHFTFFDPNTKKTVTVPVHGNEYLGIGLIKKILRDAELSTETYEKLRLRKQKD